MMKWDTADLVNLNCKDGRHYNNCQMCLRCCLLCTCYGDIQNGKTMWGLKTRGTARNFLAFNSDSSYVSKKYSFTKYNTLLNVQTYIFLYYGYGPLMSTVWPIYGTLVPWIGQLQGWMNNFFFFEPLSMSSIRVIWFTNREQSNVLQAKFVVLLCETHSFILVNNAKLGHRKKPCLICQCRDCVLLNGSITEKQL